MSEEHTGKISITKQKTDWEKMRSVTEEEIRTALECDPEIHPTDEDFWKDAKVIMPCRQESDNAYYDVRSIS
jgi:hypothetical protein